MEDKQKNTIQPDSAPSDTPAPLGGQTFHPESASTPNPVTPVSPEKADTSVTPPAPGATIEPPASTPEQPVNTPDAQTAPAPTSVGVVDAQQPTAAPPKKKGLKKSVLIGGIVGLVLLLGGGAYAAYAQLVMPERVLSQYASRLADFNSGRFNLAVNSHVDDEASPVSFEIATAGSFSVADEEDIRFDTQSDVSINTAEGGLSINFDLNIDARYLEDTAYVRTNNVDFLGYLLPGLEADTWYSFDVESEREEFTDATCAEADQEAIIDYFDNHVADRVEIVDARRHTWLPIERNGHRVQHYSGAIPGSTLGNIVRDLEDRTSDDCISEDDLYGIEDLDDFLFSYNLYTANDYDELVVVVSEDGENVADIALTTQDYNQPVEIEAPAESVDFEEVIGSQMDMFGDYDESWDFNDSEEFDESWDYGDEELFFDFEPEVR